MSSPPPVFVSSSSFYLVLLSPSLSFFSGQIVICSLQSSSNVPVPQRLSFNPHSSFIVWYEWKGPSRRYLHQHFPEVRPFSLQEWSGEFSHVFVILRNCFCWNHLRFRAFMLRRVYLPSQSCLRRMIFMRSVVIHYWLVDASFAFSNPRIVRGQIERLWTVWLFDRAWERG